MTPSEGRVIQALNRADFVPGTGPKRFIRDMAVKNPDVYILTDRQRAYLWAIAWSWRRQLPADLVQVVRKESGGRGINSRSNPPDLPAPAPRKKRDRVPPLLAYQQALWIVRHIKARTMQGELGPITFDSLHVLDRIESRLKWKTARAERPGWWTRPTAGERAEEANR